MIRGAAVNDTRPLPRQSPPSRRWPGHVAQVSRSRSKHSNAAKAERAVERMRGVNADALELANRLEPVVGSFCIALGSQPYHVHRFVQDDEASGSARISGAG